MKIIILLLFFVPFSVLGLSKVMVATGYTAFGYAEFVEIVDLLSNSTQCQNFPSFPRLTQEAIGALDNNDNPIICGGGDPATNQCDTFVNGKWVSSQPMTEARFFSSMIKSPFLNDSISLLVTGGSQLDTAEVLLNEKWKNWPINLPVKIDCHCMVMLNSTALILIGGHQDAVRHSNRTHILNLQNGKWIDGPELQLGRGFHSCARIPTNSQSSEYSIIVVGGYKGHYLSSVEILDEGSSKWRQGPELPHPMSGSATVDHPLGGIALIGGKDITDFWDPSFFNTIYHLPHAGDEAKWELMPQKLKDFRGSHVAFLVTDEVADYCEK